MHRVVGFVMMELQVGGKAVEAYALGRSDQLKGNCAPPPTQARASRACNPFARRQRSSPLPFVDGCLGWPDINKTVSWGTDCVHPGGEPSKITCASHTNSLSSLAGKEVAVKVAMADAELYSISFGCSRA